MTTNDNDELRLIVTKRGEYVILVSDPLTWEQRYPGCTSATAPQPPSLL